MRRCAGWSTTPRSLGVDPARISVGGGSAGGNLTAVVALMARDRGGPPLVFQVLEIPVTDLTMSYPSVVENGTGFMLTEEGMRQYVNFYLRDPADAKHPYALPDLRGGSPRVALSARHDGGMRSTAGRG